MLYYYRCSYTFYSDAVRAVTLQYFLKRNFLYDFREDNYYNLYFVMIANHEYIMFSIIYVIRLAVDYDIKIKK